MVWNEVAPWPQGLSGAMKRCSWLWPNARTSLDATVRRRLHAVMNSRLGRDCDEMDAEPVRTG